MSLAQKIRDNPLRTLCLVVAAFYAAGFVQHGLDLIDLRLKFSEMDDIHKYWTIYLVIADPLVAFLLWKQKKAGEYLFQVVAVSQIIAHWGFSHIFGRLDILILFHILTITIYWKIIAKQKRKEFGDKGRYS